HADIDGRAFPRKQGGDVDGALAAAAADALGEEAPGLVAGGADDAVMNDVDISRVGPSAPTAAHADDETEVLAAPRAFRVGPVDLSRDIHAAVAAAAREALGKDAVDPVALGDDVAEVVDVDQA